MLTLIRNAAIVSTRDGSIARDMTLVLQGDSIQAIGPTRTAHVDSTVLLDYPGIARVVA